MKKIASLLIALLSFTTSFADDDNIFKFWYGNYYTLPFTNGEPVEEGVKNNVPPKHAIYEIRIEIDDTSIIPVYVYFNLIGMDKEIIKKEEVGYLLNNMYDMIKKKDDSISLIVDNGSVNITEKGEVFIYSYKNGKCDFAKYFKPTEETAIFHKIFYDSLRDALEKVPWK